MGFLNVERVDKEATQELQKHLMSYKDHLNNDPVIEREITKYTFEIRDNKRESQEITIRSEYKFGDCLARITPRSLLISGFGEVYSSPLDKDKEYIIGRGDGIGGGVSKTNCFSIKDGLPKKRIVPGTCTTGLSRNHLYINISDHEINPLAGFANEAAAKGEIFDLGLNPVKVNYSTATF